MKKEEVFAKINEWEQEYGESFVDRFNADIRPLTFMTWCLGRHYLTPDKFNAWNKAWHNNELEAEDPNYFVYNADNDEEVPYAVVISNEWNPSDQARAYEILAEFISEINVYVDRFKEFLSE